MAVFSTSMEEASSLSEREYHRAQNLKVGEGERRWGRRRTLEAHFQSSLLKRSLFIDFGGAVTLIQTRKACLGAGGGGASAEPSGDSGLWGLPPPRGLFIYEAVPIAEPFLDTTEPGLQSRLSPNGISLNVPSLT